MPVLSVEEASASKAVSEGRIPVPHPELGRTPSRIPAQMQSANLEESAILRPGAHTDAILSELGITASQRALLREQGALGHTGAKL